MSNYKSPQECRQFVKAEGDKLKKMMGDPNKSALSERFNADMSNTGESANKAGRKLWAGMDKAFPYK